MAGTAELLRRQGYDTLAVRRAVTSPGGSTARGLAALERGGLRAAFADALDAVLKRMTVVLATVREDDRRLRQRVFYVYTLLIIAYILSSLFFAFGGRVPVRALVERGARLPARRLRALPVDLPALHPAARPARPQPDRRDPRCCRSSAAIVVGLIRRLMAPAARGRAPRW